MEPKSDSEFTDMLSPLSEGILPKKARLHLRKIYDELNQFLFLDENGEMAVDRDTLIRFCSNESLIPAGLRDIAILETAKHLGRRVKGLGKGRRITWRDGEKYGLPISMTDLRTLGITEKMSIDEIGVVLKTQFPELPKFWMNENSTQLAEEVLNRFRANRTVWECLYINLGFWAVVNVVGSIAIFALLIQDIGWQGCLILAIIWLGVTTAYVLLQCLANPYFHQF